MRIFPHARWGGGLVLGAALTVAATVASAQGPAQSFDELQAVVKPGDKVSVTDVAGREVTGRIREISSSRLGLVPSDGGPAAGPYEWDEREVMTIRQRRADSLIEGALIGALAGGVIGLLGAHQCAGNSSCSGSRGAFVALGVGVGAGVGIGIDAAITTHRVIYQRPASTQVSPGQGAGPGIVLVRWRF